MDKSLIVKELFYDENGDLIVITKENKIFKFINPYLESIDLGKGEPVENNSVTIEFKNIINRDDK
jgi:hypothetical protein